MAEFTFFGWSNPLRHFTYTTKLKITTLYNIADYSFTYKSVTLTCRSPDLFWTKTSKKLSYNLIGWLYAISN